MQTPPPSTQAHELSEYLSRRATVWRRSVNNENVLQRETPLPLRNQLMQKNLTPRELEILRMIGQGMSNKEISLQTDAAPNTIKVHLRRIFQKLGVHTRADAAAVSVQRGLVG